MKYLVLDTSYTALAVGVIDAFQVINKKQVDAGRKQSELLIPTIDEVLKQSKLTIDDVDAIVVTKGPGSYTGVRMAMMFAKMIGISKQKKVYTLSTLQVYGLSHFKSVSVIDAKSNMVYVGAYENKKCIVEDCLMSIEDAKEQFKGYIGFGDSLLIGIEPQVFDIVENMCALHHYYEEVVNIHTLTPVYLKDAQGISL